MPSLIDIRTRWASDCIVLIFTVVGLFSAGSVTAAEDSRAVEKTVEKFVSTSTNKIAEQDVPNTAESKQKHVYLVRNAIMGSSRYKQYSDADKINVRILLDGLEPMAVRFHKPVEVSNRLLDAFEDYSCVVVEILRCRKDIETMPERSSPYFFLNWEGSRKDIDLNKVLVAKGSQNSIDTKRAMIKCCSVRSLYSHLVKSQDELNYFCSENSVDVLSKSLCSQNKARGSKDSTFDSFQRLEKLMDKNFSMPIMDDDPEEFH